MGATMNLTITVSGYNRPAYLEQTLAALALCEGAEHCRTVVLLDPCDETQQCVEIAARYQFPAYVHSAHAGCNRAILAALAVGFDDLGSEYHVHLEDDTVPCRDALRWFAWARDAYRDDPAVFSVSGYQRVSSGRVAESGLRRWFTPWGWATWRDRFDGIRDGWSRHDDISWDVVVNHRLRAGRYEAFPTVSRIQNIGAERGTHVPDAEWHRQNQHVAETADDLKHGPVLSWGEVRRDDHADHA